MFLYKLPEETRENRRVAKVGSHAASSTPPQNSKFTSTVLSESSHRLPLTPHLLSEPSPFYCQTACVVLRRLLL